MPHFNTKLLHQWRRSSRGDTKANDIAVMQLARNIWVESLLSHPGAVLTAQVLYHQQQWPPAMRGLRTETPMFQILLLYGQFDDGNIFGLADRQWPQSQTTAT